MAATKLIRRTRGHQTASPLKGAFRALGDMNAPFRTSLVS